MAKSDWRASSKLDPVMLFFFAMACCFCTVALAGDGLAARKCAVDDQILPRYGIGVNLGLGYDPSETRNFMSITGFVLYDYEDIWPHRAPDQLKFKLEGSLGTTMRSSPDFIASAGFLALYYFEGLSNRLLRPYIEGGVGLIYTEYKVKGQGSKLNFNPQAGLGIEFSPQSGPDFWVSLRLHHLSNAGLNKDNRGVNSLVLQTGKLF
ncbi:MAG: acyloxyacyl hydrolase [Desulfonatronovibrio sp.]